MYAGTIFTKKAGRLSGVHQRIDKLARKAIIGCVRKDFPKIDDILKFEGLNGPDGIKRKSPGEDEPWHFINPENANDTALLDLIDDHIYNLSWALKESNYYRASFEAAWLAHSITDGLTPAHHYPLAEKIEELWGKPAGERSSVVDKNFIKGDSLTDSISKNWQYWGRGGIFTAHAAFELGVATSMVGARIKINRDNISKKVDLARHSGFRQMMIEAIDKIYSLNMYSDFGKNGWNKKLATQTTNILIPIIVEMIAIAWILADSGDCLEG